MKLPCPESHHNLDRPAPEDPVRQVEVFKQAESRTRRTPDDLLSFACQLLHLAPNGLVMSRDCTRIIFEFEGYRTHAVFALVAPTDSEDELILALDLLQKRQSDGEYHLVDILEKAAEVNLNAHFPEWRENEGSDGHLTVAISRASDGHLVLAPRGNGRCIR